MKNLFLTALIGISLLGGASQLRADDNADLNKEINQLNDTAKTLDGQKRVLEKISQATGVPATTLEAERKSSKLGFGELMIAHLLATSSGKTYDQILNEFKSGKGWGQIAKDNKVKLGGLVSKAHESAQGAEHGKGNDNGHGAGAHGNSGGKGGNGGGGGHGKGH